MRERFVPFFTENSDALAFQTPSRRDRGAGRARHGGVRRGTPCARRRSERPARARHHRADSPLLLPRRGDRRDRRRGDRDRPLRRRKARATARGPHRQVPRAPADGRRGRGGPGRVGDHDHRGTAPDGGLLQTLRDGRRHVPLPHGRNGAHHVPRRADARRDDRRLHLRLLPHLARRRPDALRDVRRGHGGLPRAARRHRLLRQLHGPARRRGVGRDDRGVLQTRENFGIAVRKGNAALKAALDAAIAERGAQ